MPEVAGDAALMVDPYDETAIGAAILKLLSEPTLRKACIHQGLQWVKQFSWEKTARETLAIYKKIL